MAEQTIQTVPTIYFDHAFALSRFQKRAGRERSADN
jgi:hypothetical protein